MRWALVVLVAKEAMSLVVCGEREGEWGVDVFFISVSMFWVMAGCGCLKRKIVVWRLQIGTRCISCAVL